MYIIEWWCGVALNWRRLWWLWPGGLTLECQLVVTWSAGSLYHRGKKTSARSPPDSVCAVFNKASPRSCGPDTCLWNSAVIINGRTGPRIPARPLRLSGRPRAPSKALRAQLTQSPRARHNGLLCPRSREKIAVKTYWMTDSLGYIQRPEGHAFVAGSVFICKTWLLNTRAGMTWKERIRKVNSCYRLRGKFKSAIGWYFRRSCCKSGSIRSCWNCVSGKYKFKEK